MTINQEIFQNLILHLFEAYFVFLDNQKKNKILLAFFFNS
jgi:hypothetical protein